MTTTTKTLDFQVEAVETYLQRAADIRGGSTPTATVKARMAAAAQNLSLAGSMRAHLDVCIEALCALVDILYEADEDGQPANFDRATGRIFLPLPWGDHGWKGWGLRQWEAKCLRRVMMERAAGNRRLPPLFDYNEFNQRWYLDFATYTDVQVAMSWIRRDGPSLAEWRTVVTEYRDSQSARMRERRGK